MSGAFPISWGFGGLAVNKRDGVISVYICLRYGAQDHVRKPIGVIFKASKRKIKIRRY